MARDMAKKSVYDEEWKKANTMMCGIRIQNSTGIPDGLNRAISSTGISKNAYIIAALREKLIRDGYLSPQEDTDTPEE